VINTLKVTVLCLKLCVVAEILAYVVYLVELSSTGVG